MNKWALYNASLHIGLGAWTYMIGATPFIWKMSYGHFDVVGSDGKMVYLHVGPLSFSVTYEETPPHWTKTLTKVEEYLGKVKQALHNG